MRAVSAAQASLPTSRPACGTDFHGDEGLVRVLAFAASLLHAPLALLHYAGEGELTLKAQFGARPFEAQRAIVFAAAALSKEKGLFVPDARAEPCFAAAAEAGLRFYAGVPLLGSARVPVGTIGVLDHVPRPAPTPEETRLLEDLARTAADRLQQLDISRRCASMTRRAAVLEQLLRQTAEAPQLDGALGIAAAILREATGGLYCHVWRLQMPQARALLVAEAGTGIFATPAYLDRLRSFEMIAATSALCRALISGEQATIRTPDPLPTDPVYGWETSPTAFLMAAACGQATQITTSFSLLDERYSFCVGLGPDQSEVDELALLLQDITVALRPLLRRRIDEVSAALFRRAVDAVPNPVLITDAEWAAPGPRILYVNPAFERETGHAATEVLGRTPKLLRGPKSNHPALKNIWRSLLEGKPVREKLVNYRRDGTLASIAVDIAPVMDAAGSCTHFVAVHRDVTLGEASERAQREAMRELAHFIHDGVEVRLAGVA